MANQPFSAGVVTAIRKRAPSLDTLAALAAFTWPFLFLFPYVVPADGRVLVVGNDFHILYYTYKAYLLDSLAHFHFPLWSPSEAAGYPFYANPFSQAFYPLNLVLALIYRLNGGWSVLDHQRYTVLGLAIFSLGLYRWLRALQFSVRASLSSTIVMAVSFKLTELLRFPNAVHTVAWYPWVLYYITLIVEATSTRARVTSGVLMAAALVCMLTGGYPYYIVYAPFLFGPYLLIRLVPRWSRGLLGTAPVNVSAALATTVAAGALALAIAAPYLMKLGALMQQTTDRAGASFEYSTTHVFTLTDSIGAWIFPPATQIEGWYYFGMVNALLVFLYALHRRHPLTMVLLGWIAIVTYITYGRSSYLFALMWQYLPGIAGLRVWSRMNIILVPILAWLLASALVHFEALLTRPPEADRGIQNRRPVAIVAAVFAGVVALQLYANSHWHDGYWTQYYAGGILSDGVLVQLGIYLRQIGIPYIMFVAMVAAGAAVVWIATVAFGRGLRVWIGALALLVALVAMRVYLGGSLARDVTTGFHFLLPWVGVALPITRPQLVALAEASFVAFGFAGFIVLTVLLIAAPKLRTNTRPRVGALVGITALGTLDLWAVGPWTWAVTVRPVTPRNEVRVAQQNADSFRVPRLDTQALSLAGPFTVGPMDNWYFQRYNDFLRFGEREPVAMKQLLGLVDGRKLLFSKAIGGTSIQEFLDDAAQFGDVARVETYTGDELVVRLRAPTDGYLSFIDNWDPDWEASVNGAPVRIDLLFGTFKAVRVSAGESLVRFRYRPFRLGPP